MLGGAGRDAGPDVEPFLFTTFSEIHMSKVQVHFVLGNPDLSGSGATEKLLDLKLPCVPRVGDLVSLTRARARDARRGEITGSTVKPLRQPGETLSPLDAYLSPFDPQPFKVCGVHWNLDEAEDVTVVLSR